MSTSNSEQPHNKLQFIGVGSPVVDLIAEVQEDVLYSIPGQKGGMELVNSRELLNILGLIRGGFIKAPGGSAGNTTFALARMGISCAFLGKLGNDDNGSYYRDTFRQVNGDCSRFKIDDVENTATCLSLVTPDYERTMRTYLGAAMKLTPDDISPDDFAGCHHAHVEGYLLFNRDLMMAVLDSAKDAGCSISLDLGSFEVVEAAREILPDILEHYVNIVFANEEEAESFCGESEPKNGLETLGSLCGVAAVKLGKKGALLKNTEETIFVPAMPVEDVLDTTGAGDYWAAGFLYGFINRYSLEKSGHLGALLGGYVVQNLGAKLLDETWESIIQRLRNIE